MLLLVQHIRFIGFSFGHFLQLGILNQIVHFLVFLLTSWSYHLRAQILILTRIWERKKEKKLQISYWVLLKFLEQSKRPKKKTYAIYGTLKRKKEGREREPSKKKEGRERERENR